jgi:catechol 2,3-dioxygenase-like lactoylglutathione lyase family enzyme
MISSVSHITYYVKNQDSAREFYTQKLGFTLAADIRMGDFRWLTVRAPQQPDLEIALLEPAMMYDQPDDVAKLFELQAAGKLGGGVLKTADCAQTYQELVAKGVKFRRAPQPRPFGIEAAFDDDSGNWFSLVQPAAKPPGRA